MSLSSMIFLPVSDIEKTLVFYRDVIKLPIYMKQSDTLYVFDTGYGYWGFCQYDDGRKPLSGPKGVCLSINLADCAAVDRKYEESKDTVDILRKPSRHPIYPVYSFFLQDPDGYLVEYQKTDY